MLTAILSLAPIASSVFGFVSRFAVEWFKKKDRDADRAHEIEMFSLQLEADKLKAQQQLAQTNVENSAKITLADIGAMTEAIRVQGQLTGVKWVDALNSAIRPFLAVQWLLILWPTVIIANIVLMYVGNVPAVDIIAKAWGPAEQSLASSIAGFWLADRSLKKR